MGLPRGRAVTAMEGGVREGEQWFERVPDKIAARLQRYVLPTVSKCLLSQASNEEVMHVCLHELSKICCSTGRSRGQLLSFVASILILQ